MRLRDRKKDEYALAPTAEEEITRLVADEMVSAKHLPLRLYQIGRKYRDEIRPRFGLMRSREFIMKDMYTFDITAASATHTYHEVCRAYHNIFQRIGVRVVQVEADTGKIGGTLSHEFQLLSEVGEDEVLSCACGRYSANKELAVGILPSEAGKRSSFAAGDLLSMLESAVREKTPRFKLEAALDAQKTTGALILLERGREVNPIKVQGMLGSGAEVVHPNHLLGRWHQLETVRVLVDGSLGHPVPGFTLSQEQRQTAENSLLSALTEKCTAIHLELPAGWRTGAEKALGGLLDTLAKEGVATGHFRFAREGDLCGRCAGGQPEVSQPVLKAHRGIELGHAFYLGTKYSAKLEAQLTRDGVKTPMIMGCFGLGLGRIMAGVAEVSHDKEGIIWPLSLAPYRLCIIADKSPQLLEKARVLSKEIAGARIPGLEGEVVFDDREESVGFKLKDAQLIGYPWIAVLGK